MPRTEWKPMLVEGGLVSAEWLVDAWERTKASGTPHNLRRNLNASGPVAGRDAPYPAPQDMPQYHYISEIGNRMLQRARKAGEIEFTGQPRQWVFIPEPEQEIQADDGPGM